MKTSPTAVVVLLSLALAVEGDFIFNVDFEDPPHVVNQQVVTGSAVDLPTGADPTVMIRTNLADFTTQVASLEPAGAMGFFYAPSVASGLVRLSWDLALIDHGPGSGFESAAVGVQSSGGGGLNIFYLKDMTITLNGMNVGTCTTGVSDNFSFVFDLNADIYDFSMNGSSVLTNQALGASFDLQNVVFSRDSDEFPSYAVDNFQWEVIPEPSASVLMLLGGLGCLLFKRR